MIETLTLPELAFEIRDHLLDKKINFVSIDLESVDAISDLADFIKILDQPELLIVERLIAEEHNELFAENEHKTATNIAETFGYNLTTIAENFVF